MQEDKVTLILKDARKLVKRGWNQKYFAVDGSGYPCSSNSPHAVSWCAAGALNCVTVMLDPLLDKAYERLIAVLPEDCEGSIVTFNDHHTKEEVLELFDKAIENDHQS